MENTKKTLALAFLLVLTLSFTSALTDTIYLDDYEVTYTYSGAEEDDTFTVTVEINNTGTDKSDVVFEFDDKDPFELDQDPEWVIGNLSENELVSHSFRVDVDSGTDEGDYDLEFTLEDSKDDYDDEFKIEVNSNNADLIVGSIVSSPSIIIAGQDDIQLEVTLENIGGGDANFVRAELVLPEGFERSGSYTDNVNLGSINSGDSKTASFFINTLDDVSEENTAELILNYKSNLNKKTSRLSIDLPVKGRPMLDILSSTTTPSTISQGDEGELRITIQNNGQEKGEETSIRIFENTDIPLEFDEKTKYVGDLDVGESGSAVFSFTSKSSAQANTYLVKVQVRTVNSDSVLTEDFNIPVTIQVKESNPMNLFIIGVILLFVVLIGILIWANTRK